MRNLSRREFIFRAGLFGASLFAVSACVGGGQPATRATADSEHRWLESDVITALEHLYLAEPAARQLIGVSAGVLVFPTLMETAPLSPGEIGQGALRMANVFTDYFRLVSQSSPSSRSAAVSGLKTIVFAFTSFDVLNELRIKRTWPAERAQLLSASGLETLAGESVPKYPPVAALVLEGKRGEKLAADFSLHGLTIVPFE